MSSSGRKHHSIASSNINFLSAFTALEPQPIRIVDLSWNTPGESIVVRKEEKLGG
jgi:hypothetical protein